MAQSNETAPPPIQPALCPLARSADGHAIELPQGAVAWRVRRQTGGRPRIMLGVDKQPMQLPLAYNLVDLEDILAPGAYRLDAVDQRGEALGVTIPVSIGTLRNGSSDEDEEPEPAAVATSLPAAGSETQLVLEANVRATQMAFLHNQKSLELGLRMAETLRDGVRVLAESQADWIQSIASAKGFFRSARTIPTTSTDVIDVQPATDTDADGEPEEVAPDAHWVDKLMPHVVPLVQLVVPMLAERLGRATGDAAAGSAVKLELADLFDWRRVEQKRAAALAAAPKSPPSPRDASLLSSLPPAMMQRLLQVRSMLAPEEQQRAMQLLAAFAPEDVDALIKHLEPMTVEQVAEFLRAQLAKIPVS